MTRLGIGVLCGLLATAMLTAGADQKQEAERLLKAATNAELVDGNLKAAIDQYRRIVDTYGKTARTTAAQALLRMAECYQKLGDAQAQKIYERIMREFGEQGEAVALARTRLGRAKEPLALARGDRAVWTGSRVDLFGRVSPDGRYVTYVDWALYGNLALHDVATDTDHLLTPKKTWEDADGASASWSAISPDGKQVAYGWQSTNPEIRVVPLDPAAIKEPRRVRTFDASEVRFLGVRDWSPDGKSLAVGLSRKDGTSQIAIVSVADGALRLLKSTDWRGADRIAFSRDGQYVAYDLPATEESDQRDVFVMAVDGSREVPAVVHMANDLVVGWSPDGRQLLFSSDRTGSNALWAVGVTEGRPQGPAELLKADIGADSYPLGLTNSGALFVYKNISSRDVKIARLDMEAGTLAGPTLHFSQGYLAAPQDPHWSPDGKHVVYQTRGGQEGLAVRSIETGEARRIPRKLLYARDPRWSPDGRSLILAGRDGKGRDGIFQVDVQSGGFTPIVYGARLGAEPRWSADGTKIYYRGFEDEVGGVRGAGRGRVIERDLRSGAEREVFKHPLLQNVEVSPDGRLLAVETTVDPATQSALLLVVSVADGSAREVLRLTAQAAFSRIHTIAWTPDSRAILVARKTSGRPELWSVDVASGRSRTFDVDRSDWAAAMSDHDESNFLDGGFSLSPDGRQVAFLMGKSGAEVWALENFLPPPAANATRAPANNQRAKK
jgi:Tol biopolymer transport system component